LDTLLGIFQSDAGTARVPQARGKLTEISAGVKRVLAYSPLLRVYEADPPLPEKPLQGQLMDHDEALFEAELQHRRNMLAEVMDRLGEGAS
jgi:hypothetical protein